MESNLFVSMQKFQLLITDSIQAPEKALLTYPFFQMQVW